MPESEKPLAEFEHIDEPKLIFPGQLLEKLINDFVNHHDSELDLLGIVAITAILIEHSVKKSLSDIHPALVLPDNKLANCFVDTFSSEEVTLGESEKVAKITTLISRYRKIKPTIPSSSLQDFNFHRNAFMHAKTAYKTSHANLVALLSGSILPFLVDNIEVNLESRNRLQSIAKNINDEFIKDFTVEIFKKRDSVMHLLDQEVQKRIERDPVVSSDQFIIKDYLRCPACDHDYTVYMGEVDIHKGEVLGSREFSACRVCGLEMDRIHIDLIVEDPTTFFWVKDFINDENIEEWKEECIEEWNELIKEQDLMEEMDAMQALYG